MKQGILFYDEDLERYDFEHDGKHYGGLHCGDYFKVLLNGRWIDTSIEYSHDNSKWYLTGLDSLTLDNLKIRMD